MARPSGEGHYVRKKKLLRVSGFEVRTDGNNNTKAGLEGTEARGADVALVRSSALQVNVTGDGGGGDAPQQ